MFVYGGYFREGLIIWRRLDWVRWLRTEQGFSWNSGVCACTLYGATLIYTFKYKSICEGPGETITSSKNPFSSRRESK